jgi:hypothetical protein
MVVVLAWVACRAEPELVVGPADFVDGSLGGVVSVAPSVGPAPHVAVVRSLNAWGAAVSAPSASLTIDGVPTTVAFDGLGFGAISVAEPGAHVVEGGVEAVTVGAFATTGLRGWFPGSLGIEGTSVVAPASGGVAVLAGDTIWWVDATHRYPVLSTPDGSEILGMKSGNIDTDGVVDALAWTSDTLFILRGRNGGGLAWGTALKADFGVVAATIGDADVDGNADVLVVWEGAAGRELEVLWGGSGWEFTRSETVSAGDGLIAMDLGDAYGDGAQSLTITQEYGWERLEFQGRQASITGPNFTDLVFDQGGGLHASDDLNGDGGAEIVTWGPLATDQTRELYMMNLVKERPTTVTLEVVGGRFAFGDASGDGVADGLLLSSNRELSQLYGSPDVYHQTRIGALGQAGELAMSDLTGDQIPELYVGGAIGEWWLGGRVDGDNGPVWSPSAFAGRRVAAQLTGPALAVDLDGAPATADFVGFAQEGTATLLRAFRVGVGPLWSATLNGALETGVDLAICGADAYALTPSGLYRVDTARGVVVASTSIVGSKVDCGVGPSGAAVGVLVPDAVSLFDAGLGLVASEPHVGARDLALFQASEPAVATCDTDGCSIVRWEAGAGDLVAKSDGQTTVVMDGLAATTVPVGGTLGVGDVDGDGTLDLTAAQYDVEGRVAVWRGLGASVAPVEVYHTTAIGEGALLFADGDADGVPDGWVRQGADLFLPGG